MYLILSQKIDSESDYKDIPFIRYHFPKRYRNQIKTGDLFIYNQGNRHKSEHRYYFGSGVIGKIWKEEDSNDHYFAEIRKGKRFLKKVKIHKPDGSFIESIDYSQVREKKIPPFRSAIRKLSQSAYHYILERSDGFLSMDRYLMKDILIESLKNHSGSADIVTICRYVWNRYEKELRESGDLFYTWQYNIRWAATDLRKSGAIKAADVSPKGVWELNG